MAGLEGARGATYRNAWDVPRRPTGRFAMTRPARRTLSAWIVVAMAVGALLVAPVRAGAVTGSAGPGSMVAAGPHRIHPGELRRLLDPVVAAGAPGAAARVRDGHRVTQAA